MRKIWIIVATMAVALGAGVVPAAGTTTPWATQDDVRVVDTLAGTTGGATAVEGDRLYVGAYGLGLRIFDISDARSPAQLGMYAPPTVGPYDPGLRMEMVPHPATWDGRTIVALSGRYLTGGAEQVEFLDVTDPDDPVLLHRFSALADRAPDGAVARDARLWLPTSGAPSGGLRIYDMDPLLASPPQRPAELFRGNPNELWKNSPYRTRLGKPEGSAFATTRGVNVYEDMTVLLPEWEWEPDEEGVPQPNYAQKDIVLLAAGSSAGELPGIEFPANQGAVYVIDISIPTNPVVMNKWQNPDDGGHPMHDMQEAQFLDGDPSTLVVTDRDDFGGCDSGRLYTVSISEDLTQAEKRAEWAVGAGQAEQQLCAGVRGFSSHDRLVYLGAAVAGVQVVDLRDPADPVGAGRYVAEGANYLDALYHEGVIYAGDQGPRGLDVLEYIGDFDAKAIVHAANPASTTLGGGISEDLAACDPDSDQNGVDGFWVEVPGDQRDGDATLRALGSSPLGYDIEVRFFDESCGPIRPGLTGAEGDREGTVPDGAAYAYVQLVTGAPQWVYVKLT